MSEGEAPLVGVVERSDVADRIAEAVADAGGHPTTGAAADVIGEDVTIHVTAGERAFVDVATRAPAAPILPVEAGWGVRSVPAGDVEAAIDDLLAFEWPTEDHPLLAIRVDGERWATALMDVALVTAEAAHISEYRVAAGDARLGSVRADGVVVATPAGSPGYARRIGSPVIGPGTGAVVAPIAPFATDPDDWVVDPDGVTVEPTRGDAAVDLVVDDAVAGSIEQRETVACRVEGRVSTVVLPESRSRYR
jgi:NAD+ kinase